MPLSVPLLPSKYGAYVYVRMNRSKIQLFCIIVFKADLNAVIVHAIRSLSHAKWFSLVLNSMLCVPLQLVLVSP